MIKASIRQPKTYVYVHAYPSVYPVIEECGLRNKEKVSFSLITILQCSLEQSLSLVCKAL